MKVWTEMDLPAQLGQLKTGKMEMGCSEVICGAQTQGYMID